MIAARLCDDSLAMLQTLFKILLVIVSCLAVIACAQIVRNSGTAPLPAPSADVLRVATYNVHYINVREESGPWSRGDWEQRKGPLDLAFKEIAADVIGFQEMESFAGRSESSENLTLEWLLENNPDYEAAAVGDPAVFPSTQPILYRQNRLTLVDQGWFFFSETPDVIYSRTFNGSYPAFTSWAVFDDKVTQSRFRVVNIHTDYGSRSNKLQSAELVATRIAPWIAEGETVYVIGDLNARLGERTVDIIENAGITFAPVSGATYHFDRGINLFGAIDHIGYVGATTPRGEPVVLRKRYDGEWPTDHYPVIVDFTGSQ